MRVFNFIALLLSYIRICLFQNGNGYQLMGQGVIGGVDVEPEEIKFLVSVQIRKWHLCGGGIIGDRYILTAAHCVVDITSNKFKKGPWRIVAGTNDVNDEDTEVILADVEEIFVPKTFHIPKKINEWWNADIAVLKLKQSLDLSSSQRLRKLRLPSPLGKSFPTYTNATAKIAGFGWDFFGKFSSPWGGSYVTHSMSGQAHQVTVKISEQAECKSFLPLKLLDSELCAKINQPNLDVQAGTCSGDSGSPLVYDDDTVIGVMVRAEDPCNQNVIPAVYTRVSSYVDFIENAMQGITEEMRHVKV